MRHKLLLVGLTLAAVPFASCNCNPVQPVTGDVCGTGTVDGSPYAIDDAKTRMVIVVQRNDGAGCGVFHNHVVNAKIAKLEYSLNTQDVGKSTFKMTVLASGLDPDDADLRDEFLTKHDPPLDGQPLSDGDRQSIKGSVADEVLATDNPTLVFTISDMSSPNGEGTAKVKAALAGAESTVDATYKISKDGDNFVIKDATATLDGAPYGIPRNSLGFCVNPSMELHFDLVLTKADATPVCDIGNGDTYTPQVFGDDACAENIGFNEARDVVVKRCAGCHAAEQRLGATVPLVTWDDWRTDSIRNQGKPLYETASEYIHLPEDQSLSMPPQDASGPLATDLTEDELAVADAWFADGARNEACDNDPGAKVFPHATAVECSDTLSYEATDDANPSAQGQSAKVFFDNNCAYCHLDTASIYLGVPQLSKLDGNGAPVIDDVTTYGVVDHDIARSPVFHGYYQGDDGVNLNFWEASVLRFLDGSMPPGGGIFDPTVCTTDDDCSGAACFVPTGQCVDPGFIAFSDWVTAGYAPDACP